MSNVYQPPTFAAPIELDLSRNEGRPAIRRLVLEPSQLAAVTSRYPDTRDLSAAVAERHRIAVDRVLVTAGGDDALLRCFLATAGSAAVATTPSFEMISRYAAQVATPLIEVPWWDGDFPIDGFLAETAGTPGMAVIVSPNNPTGNVVGQGDLRKVADVYPLVVLDAAYAEFADEDLTGAALEMGNVVVIRTLSKAFGLAGLRVGYLLGAEEMVSQLAGYGSPFSISALSASLAQNAVGSGIHAAERFAGEIGERRERLHRLLIDLGCVPLPSQGNFVLATDVAPQWLVAAAASLGVGLRGFQGRPELDGCVRITVPPDEPGFRRLGDTLAAVLGPQALLFDMDGVLVEVRESFRASIIATAARFGVTVTEEDVSAAKAAGDASDDWDLTRRLCAAAGTDIPLETVRDEFERLYQGEDGVEGLKERESLLVDVTALETWSQLLPLGIVTARPRRDAMAALERFEIGRFFATVVAREDAPAKPDPAPVRLALERLGVDHAWMVGDTIDDLTAARGAGVVPIAVATPGEDQAPLGAAARVMSSVNEIQEVLDVTLG